MMATLISYLCFSSICIAFIAIAFRPAWREWRVPTDCAALPIESAYTNQIAHFAQAFRESVLASLAANPDACESLFHLVPTDAEKMDWRSATKSIVAFHPLMLQRSISCPKPLYVHADLYSVGHDMFTGLYVAGQVSLGPHSELRDWAHAEGPVTLGVSSVALRRVSSAVAIELKDRCCFERLHAPLIIFGGDYEGPASRFDIDTTFASFESLPGAIRRAEGLYMICGNCILPRHHRFTGSLIVTGRLIVGSHTIVEGDIKARQGLSIGSEAIVTGSVVSEQDIKIYHRARIAGVVISEATVHIGAGAEIGTPDEPTTVSAKAIIVESGAIAHGTVWARDVGTVWSA